MAGYPYLGQITDPNAQKAVKAAFDLIGTLRAELDTLRTVALTRGSPFQAAGERITQLADPQADSDAATAQYVKRYLAAQLSAFGSDGITQLTGDVTAGPGNGSQVATVGTVGSWTPIDGSGAGLSITNATTAWYIRIGQLVVAYMDIVYPATANGSTASIAGLPLTASVRGGGAASRTTHAGMETEVRIATDQVRFFSSTSVDLFNADLSNDAIRAVYLYLH